MKLLDIVESYNTKLELNWLHQGHSLITHFDIQNEHYGIQIDQMSLTIPRRAEWTVYEVSFKRILDQISTVAQTNSRVPSKVFGIVYNGVLGIILKDKPECVIFSAKFMNDDGDQDAFNKRVQLYQSIVNRITTFGVYVDVGLIKSQHAHNFVLVRADLKITQEEINWIKSNC